MITIQLLLPVALPLTLVYLLMTIVPDPYMDEEFHVRQAQQYCANQWSNYDPKLTTPPGLYMTSLAILSIFRISIPASYNQLLIPDWLCTVTHLRLTSTVMSAVLFYVTYRIVQHNHHPQRNSPTVITWNAFNAWMHPIASFFYPLYYTDTCSTLLVMVTYYCFCVKHMYKAGAICGLVSIFVRQTNLIWIAFSMSVALLNRISHISNSDVDPIRPGSISIDWNLDLIRVVYMVVFDHFWDCVRIFGPGGSLILLLWSSMVYFHIPLVLGDQSNHQVAVHIPQVLYCALVCFGLCFPIALRVTYIQTLFKSILAELRSVRRTCCLLLLVTTFALTIKWTTYEHPFLLSDNRHLTFYIWNRGFRKHWWFRYTLIPVYMACGWLLHRRIGKDRGRIFIMALVSATSLTLIPSPLMELRYYILPSLMYRVHCVERSAFRLFLESVVHVVMYVCINYVFLSEKWTFRWPNEPNQEMRFML